MFLSGWKWKRRMKMVNCQCLGNKNPDSKTFLHANPNYHSLWLRTKRMDISNKSTEQEGCVESFNTKISKY